MMNYIEKLKNSAKIANSIICMGLDPIPESLPTSGTDSGTDIRTSITDFFETVFKKMIQMNVIPGAFKPNLGFFSCLDRPRENNFSGSLALADVLQMLESSFPEIPVILDYKRGDIARSSANYAVEGFRSWKADSVTVSPWMGSDSVEPFLKEADFHNGGVYILNRTSNPGGRELQNLREKETGETMYSRVASYILKWAEKYPGTGAVTGATSLNELSDIAEFFSDAEIPLLIPGVGSQGGSAEDVVATLKKCNYDTQLVRINVSSAITHPWVKQKTTAPENWPEVCVDSLDFFNKAAGVKY